MTCNTPTSPTALALYDLDDATETDLEAPSFNVTGVACVAGTTGDAVVSACMEDGGEYGLSGCKGTKKGNGQCRKDIAISSENKSFSYKNKSSIGQG